MQLQTPLKEQTWLISNTVGKMSSCSRGTRRTQMLHVEIDFTLLSRWLGQTVNRAYFTMSQLFTGSLPTSSSACLCSQGQCFVAINPENFAPGFTERMSDLMSIQRGLEPVSRHRGWWIKHGNKNLTCCRLSGWPWRPCSGCGRSREDEYEEMWRAGRHSLSHQRRQLHGESCTATEMKRQWDWLWFMLFFFCRTIVQRKLVWVHFCHVIKSSLNKRSIQEFMRKVMLQFGNATCATYNTS